ncbi:hypothetical protein [Paractinoplanes lichenicola]|uniref:Uncharacterized protein n=1 Tax=Paractinoplanes lichenicola TaxID=2802976 RepID=A0ABS1VMP7_9ACTN|nr:hypothetical protein [Actinoplanes lichenicola]MBL7256001.1 hypothetical protein [Actinoplanes lichenicola]
MGRLVASLAQAARCVSLNHEQLAASQDGKWRAVGVLDDASNALTLIGEALERHHTGPQEVAILLNDECTMLARRALTKTLRSLRSRNWTFGHEPELDTAVAERMETDLTLLPER